MRYVHITDGTELPELSASAPFKALIVAERPVSVERRAEISEWLVEMGCRYVMSHGMDCESWSNAMRKANLEAFDIDSMSAKDFVMTTSHPTEPMRWMMWFAKKIAKHPENTFKDLVVLHFADWSRSTEFIAMYQKA